MSNYPKLMEKLIGESAVGFNNAKNHGEIKEKVVSFGYDEPKLDELMELNARASEKYHEYERLHGEQLAATNRLEVKFKEELNLYSSLRKLAFRLFPGENNKGIRSQLGIDGKLKDSLDGFTAQAVQFYDTILKKEEIGNAFAEFQLDAEKLQEILKGPAELRRLNEEQEKAKGSAQLARKERDDLCQELKVAWAKFKTVCHYLFKETTPQYLKMLNISVPSYGRKKSAPTDDNGEAGETDQGNPSEMNDQLKLIDQYE